MSVFGEFFGFDGRIDGLGYLWRSLVAILAISVTAVVAIFLLQTDFDPGGVLGTEDWAHDVVIGATLLGLWSGLAITSRRLRDMGLEPLYMVPAYAALWVANGQLLVPLSEIDPAHFESLEGIWLVLQGASLIPLLLWPSAAVATPTVRGFEPTQHTAYLNWREGA